jgi:hypothetical protein
MTTNPYVLLHVGNSVKERTERDHEFVPCEATGQGEFKAAGRWVPKDRVVRPAEMIHRDMIDSGLPQSIRVPTFTYTENCNRALLVAARRDDAKIRAAAATIAAKYSLGEVDETHLSLCIPQEVFTFREELEDGTHRDWVQGLQDWMEGCDLLELNHPIVAVPETKPWTRPSGRVDPGRKAAVLILLRPRTTKGWEALLSNGPVYEFLVWQCPLTYANPRTNLWEDSSDFVEESPTLSKKMFSRTTLVDAAELLRRGHTSLRVLRKYQGVD